MLYEKHFPCECEESVSPTGNPLACSVKTEVVHLCPLKLKPEGRQGTSVSRLVY